MPFAERFPRMAHVSPEQQGEWRKAYILNDFEDQVDPALNGGMQLEEHEFNPLLGRQLPELSRLFGPD